MEVSIGPDEGNPVNSAISQFHPEPDDEFSVRREEQRLLASIRAGDISAFERLVRQFVESLVGYATAQTGIAALAEDLVQEVFASLWIRRDSITVTTSLKTYLFRAVHHQIANHFRSVHRQTRYFVSLEQQSDSLQIDAVFHGHTDDTLNEDDLRRAYTHALTHMPRRPREVFLLVREQGMSYKEAAQVLEISPRTVEEHMGRALMLLRKALNDWIR